MATQKHVWAYLGIVVLVTWLANGVIPELQAGTVPIPDTWAWLVRSLVPALVALTILLPSVVQKPPGVPDVATTNVTVTHPIGLTPTTPGNVTSQQVADDIVRVLTASAQPIRSAQSLPGAPAPSLAPTAPAPAIPDPITP